MADLFDLEGIAAWVVARGYRTVALQLPAPLLRHAPDLTARLCSLSAGALYVVLPEGRCCADEVTALRFGAQAVVQLGRTCLSPARRLPVLHALPRTSPASPPHIADCVVAALGDGARDAPVAVALDPEHQWAAAGVEGELGRRGVRAEVSRPRVHSGSEAPVPGVGPWALEGASDAHVLVYVGDDEASVSALRLSVPHSRFIHYSVASRSTQEPSETRARMIRRRLAVMRGARDAETVALVLAASPSERNVRASARLRGVCSAAGVRAIEVNVGKVSEYKLANFCDAVGAFVLCSCPLSLEYLDSRDYPLPFVSAFEYETIIKQGDMWNGEYTTDYEAFLASEGASLVDKGDSPALNELLP
eukprot:m51a1_g2820 hypothetical protein (362) ;mRNA; f:175367-176842